MLRGRFGHANKRPYIQGRLFIPRLENWSDVSFLVDTVADKTTLLPVLRYDQTPTYAVTRSLILHT